MLKTLIGEYPVTKQFLTHTDKFAFADAFKANPASAFKRVVRDLEFDVAEMAIMTHLIAKAHGKPYRLLPFVVLAALITWTVRYGRRSAAGMWTVVRPQQSHARPPRLTFQVTYSLSPAGSTAVP